MTLDVYRGRKTTKQQQQYKYSVTHTAAAVLHIADIVTHMVATVFFLVLG